MGFQLNTISHRRQTYHINLCCSNVYITGVVGTCCVVHANERNNCQHCWRKVVILASITDLSVPSFPLSVYRPPHVFHSNNTFYLTRPRGKSFPRGGQSAVSPRGLAVFWCIYSRFSIFCLNVSCFLKIFAQLSLIRHVYNNPERRKRVTIAVVVVFLKIITRRVRRRFYEANIVRVPCKRAQHCCATLRRSQNKRNVGTCCAKSLTGFKLYAASANKCQHCCGSLQTDATCWAQQCCVLLANNVASVCMGLYARATSPGGYSKYGYTTSTSVD